MRILVDTSVWVHALAGRTPFRPVVDRLLEERGVAAHEFIYGELLMREGGRRRDEFLAEYEQMYFAPRVSHPEVVRLVTNRHMRDRGVGWIDVHLLASAIVSKLQFWTADPRLASLAEELGIAYKVPV